MKFHRFKQSQSLRESSLRSIRFNLQVKLEKRFFKFRKIESTTVASLFNNLKKKQIKRNNKIAQKMERFSKVERVIVFFFTKVEEKAVSEYRFHSPRRGKRSY